MNTYSKIFIIVCASLISLACTNLEEPSYVDEEGVELTITAVREGADLGTRTIRESDGSVEWCPMDEISVFYNDGLSGGSKFTSQNTEQTAIAEFRGRLEGISAGGENFTNGKYLYGVYPYSTDTEFHDGVMTISLPAHQTAVEGTFANGLFPTIARAQGVNLAFYNICGGVKFTVSRDDITSVSLKGNNNERLAGKAKVAFNTSEIPYVLDEENDSKDEIIVYAPAGGTFEVGREYFIVVYPTTLNSGFTMNFRTSDMKIGTYVHNSAVEIERSIFGVLNQADAKVESWTNYIPIGGGDESGIYLGIVGFNKNLYPYPIRLINNESKDGFDSFIDDMTMSINTVLYYAVDETINTLQATQLPANLSTAAIVTFTDGLDEGSHGKNPTYKDDYKYLDALNNRIKNENVRGVPIIAYSIGLADPNWSSGQKRLFRDNLQQLASSDDNFAEVTSMEEVNAKFKEIAEQLSQSNFVQTINIKTQIKGDGQKIRYTFDNVANVTKSSLYVEGTFDFDTRSFKNVTYKGLTSTSGSEIKCVFEDDLLHFTFENVRTDNNVLISQQFIREWKYWAEDAEWTPNDESLNEESFDIETKRNSAVIMLVLDCSSSLGNTGFEQAKTNAKDFINTLYEAVCEDEGPAEENNAIYSTVPKDLTLAIWKEGTRYYLTKSEYDKANLSDAVIEGLTIVAGGESFILSLNDVQTNFIASVETAQKLYGDILPTVDQGKIISAKCLDINTALSNFVGTELRSSRYSGYYTSSTAKQGSYYTNCIYTYDADYYGELYDYVEMPYIRGVTNID